MSLTVRCEDPPPYYPALDTLGLSMDDLMGLRTALSKIDAAPQGDARLVALHWAFERVREAERRRIADRLLAP